MSISDEEPYSTIFASLKHPIRRRILRMLSKQSMSFSEMIEILGVSNSFLTYHLENLGQLIGKEDDGRYKLSSFGEAAIATMTKVEDIPTSAPQLSSKTILNRAVGRNVVVALGLACIILVACLGGVVVAYTFEMNDKNSAISSLNSKISQLNSNITNLQSQLDNILNGSLSVGEIIFSNPSAWVNKTVTVDGILGIVAFPSFENAPWSLELISGNQTIGVALSAGVNQSVFLNWPNFSSYARIYGVIEKGEIYFTGGPSEVTYYIEAKTIEPL